MSEWQKSPDDRRELWLLGLGLGLCCDAALLLAAVNQRWPLTAETLPAWLAVAWAVTVLGLFGLPLAVGTVRAVAAIVVGLDLWRHRNDAPPSEPFALEPEPDAAPEQANPYPDRWATYWRRLAHAGDAYGWSQSSLTTEGSPTKVMSEPAWNTTIPMLVEAGWLSGGPGRATRWKGGTRLVDFEAAEAWKTLPCPDMDPPKIALPPYTTAPQRATAAVTPRKRVVENAARQAE